MANETEKLLAVEEAVQNVLVSLNQLKQEIEGYSTAKDSLDKARDGLAALVTKTEGLAEEAHSVVAVMGKIGTPEILDRVGGLCSLTETLGRESSALIARLEASDKAQQDRQASQSTFLEGIAHSMEMTLSGLQQQMAEQHKTTAERLDEIAQKTADQEGRSLTQFNQLAMQSKRQARLLTVLLILAILLAAGSIAVHFVNL